MLADPECRNCYYKQNQGYGGKSIQPTIIIATNVGFLILHGAVPFIVYMGMNSTYSKDQALPLHKQCTAKAGLIGISI